jgi:hypothetical protein
MERGSTLMKGMYGWRAIVLDWDSTDQAATQDGFIHVARIDDI